VQPRMLRVRKKEGNQEGEGERDLYEGGGQRENCFFLHSRERTKGEQSSVPKGEWGGHMGYGKTKRKELSLISQKVLRF